MQNIDFHIVRQLVDKTLSLQWCSENLIVPIGSKSSAEGKEVLTIAVANFTYLGTVGEFIQKRAKGLGYKVEFVEMDAVNINKVIEEASRTQSTTGASHDPELISDYSIIEALKSADSEGVGEEIDLDFDDSEEVVVGSDVQDLSVEMLGSQIQRAAAEILISSCRSNVSDIHIEPRQDGYKVRVRRDGVMQSYISMPRSAGIKLTACLKNMAKMDIAERRASQDGKILRRFEGQAMEFRCSTAPGKHGEKMVLRILNSNAEMLSLDILINQDQMREDFRNILNQANGVVIISGPTGSGKSTTLASALREKDNGELNIVTAEDPIEYDLGGNIQQFPVVRAKGQTFAQLIRTFLRQDPDVILIGETRDSETAESIFDAAETGHLIFTTLNAATCAEALRYLQLTEISPQKLYMASGCILAQRLVRRVCPICSTSRISSREEASWLGISNEVVVRIATCLDAETKEARSLEGTLCERCGGSGYQGRIAIYELLEFTPLLMDKICNTSSLVGIQNILIESGMRTMLDYSRDLVLDGLTTIAEVFRVLSLSKTGEMVAKVK